MLSQERKVYRDNMGSPVPLAGQDLEEIQVHKVTGGLMESLGKKEQKETRVTWEFLDRLGLREREDQWVRKETLDSQVFLGYLAAGAVLPLPFQLQGKEVLQGRVGSKAQKGLQEVRDLEDLLEIQASWDLLEKKACLELVVHQERRDSVEMRATWGIQVSKAWKVKEAGPESLDYLVWRVAASASATCW